MTPTCSVLSDAADLERLAPAWSDLLRRSGTNEPTLTPAWLLAWWRVFGPLGGRKLRVATFRDGERLVGLAPLLARWHWYRPGIPFRRLEPLGSGEPLGDEICSEYLGVIAERGAEEDVARALATAIAAGDLGAWDELQVPWMDGSKPGPELLVSELRREGYRAELRVTSSAPYVPLPSSWDAYLKQLPSAHRYFVTRSLRDFEGWAGGTAEVRRVEKVEDLDEGFAVLRKLHGERWAAAGHDGAFASPRFRAFHEAVAPELLRAGGLDLSWIVAHGAPVAALYNVVHDGKIHFYQSGRSLDLPPKVRAGVVIHAHAIQRAIERGLREYDFLGGSLHYKSKLALSARPLVQVRATRAQVLEGMRVLAAAGIGRAAALRRSLRARGGARAAGAQDEGTP